MRLIVLSGHERKLSKVMFNRDDDLVFTSAADNTLMVWDSDTGERLGTYEGHTGAIFDFDVDYRSKYLISGSGDQSVKLWEVETGKLCYTFPTIARILSVNWCCGDKLFLAASPKFSNHKAAVHIYKNPIISNTTPNDNEEKKNDDNDLLKPIKSIKLQNTYGYSDFSIRKAIWSPLNDQIFALCSDCTIRIIDVQKATQIKLIDFDKGIKAKMKRDIEIGTHLTDIRYNTDYCTAIVCGRNKQAKMYDINRWDAPIITYECDRALNTVAIHPKLDMIAIGGGKEAQSAALEGKDGKYEPLFFHKKQKIGMIETDCFSPLNSMDWNSDGSKLVLGYEEGQARLFSMDPNFDKRFKKQSRQFTEIQDNDESDSDSDYY